LTLASMLVWTRTCWRMRRLRSSGSDASKWMTCGSGRGSCGRAARLGGGYTGDGKGT
jgi:hypothetical protein